MISLWFLRRRNATISVIWAEYLCYAYYVLPFCERIPPLEGPVPHHKGPVRRSFDVYFVVSLLNLLKKQSSVGDFRHIDAYVISCWCIFSGLVTQCWSPSREPPLWHWPDVSLVVMARGHPDLGPGVNFWGESHCVLGWQQVQSFWNQRNGFYICGCRGWMALWGNWRWGLTLVLNLFYGKLYLKILVSFTSVYTSRKIEILYLWQKK